VTPEKRKKGKWNLEEKLELIKIISSVCEPKFLKRIGSWKFNEEMEGKSEKEQKIMEKGFKKKVDKVIFYREFELRDVADMLISDPADVPLQNLPWTLISSEIVIEF